MPNCDRTPGGHKNGIISPQIFYGKLTNFFFPARGIIAELLHLQNPKSFAAAKLFSTWVQALW